MKYKWSFFDIFAQHFFRHNTKNIIFWIIFLNIYHTANGKALFRAPQPWLCHWLTVMKNDQMKEYLSFQFGVGYDYVC